MTNTTYYNLNIAEGTDIVNPLTVDNPNYEKIDEVMHDNAVASVTLATELTNATVHALTRENSDCSVIRFIATSRWKAGDSVTVDGVPVLALLPSGETLPDGAYVINANVLCVLTGTNLTVYVGKSATDANEIAYNDTTVGEELNALNESVTNMNSTLSTVNGTVTELNTSLTLDYSEANSDVQDLHTFLQRALLKLFPRGLVLIDKGYNNPSYTMSSNASSVSFTLDGATGYYKATRNGSWGAIITDKAIDLTQYSSLKVEFSNLTSGAFDFGLYTSSSSGDFTVKNRIENAASGVFSLDLTSTTGNYYLAFGITGADAASCLVKKFWLE